MQLGNSKLEFINHASVLISNNEIGLLSDPWYKGSAFNNGWKLIYENDGNEIFSMLNNKVTHIWLSHEHPDHFSIPFFKEFKDTIIKNKIKILFQTTADKRVLSYLKANKFNCQELLFKTEYKLSKDFSIICFKDGFYDSSLLIKTGNKKILNLNDCQVNDLKTGEKIKKITGDIDLLLTQFSYAAWKGGENNLTWRQKAALDKIKSIEIQVECFKPKYVVPFASYIYFCNLDNFYMNDSVNTAERIYKILENKHSEIIIMKPWQIFHFDHHDNKSSINFWNEKVNDINKNKIIKPKEMQIDVLSESFKSYRKRIFMNNNIFLMKFFYYFSPIKFFSPVYIFIEDLKKTFEVDFIKNRFLITSKKPMLKMRSDSLFFIFKNQFGWDTINVNARFEEMKKNGWSISTRTFAIETLNNMGYKFNFQLLFNKSIIRLFIKTIFKVMNNLSKRQEEKKN